MNDAGKPMSPGLARAIYAFAAFYVLAFLVLAGARAVFPYEIDNMEGGLLAMLEQLRRGGPLYVAPNLTYTPFNYPPVYFYVSAALAHVTGGGYVSMRVLSIASTLSIAAGIYFVAMRHGGARSSAIAAVGIFVGFFSRGSCDYDAARVDMLALALVFFSLVIAFETQRGVVAMLVAGALGGLAFMTKQTMLVPAVSAAAWLLVYRESRRAALVYLAAVAVTVVAVLFAAGVLFDSWFYFYNFTVPASHHIRIQRFFVGAPLYLLATLPVALGVALFSPAWNTEDKGMRPWMRVAFANPWMVALVIYLGMTLLAKAKDGGGENVFIPVAALASLQLGRYAARMRSWRGLVVFQLFMLIYPPTLLWPTQRDRALGEQIVNKVAALPGDVYLLPFPSYAVMAGKPWHTHYTSICDLSLLRIELRTELANAIHEQRFAAILARADVNPEDIGRCDIPDLDAYYEVKDTIELPHRPGAAEVLSGRPALFGLVHGNKLHAIYRPRDLGNTKR